MLTVPAGDEMGEYDGTHGVFGESGFGELVVCAADMRAP
jgi:hypothetical protein